MVFVSKKIKHDRTPIAVDFDGVIHAYTKGFYDGSIYDGPVHGVSEALKKLKERYFIYIYSQRNGTAEGRGAVEEFLKKYNVPFDAISVSKPVAKFYIDDRAIRFKNWEQTINDIAEFETESGKSK